MPLASYWKLARHSDIKMTMKYTHMGIDDRAKAVRGLPSSALHRRCNPGVFDSREMAGDGREWQQDIPKKRQNPWC